MWPEAVFWTFLFGSWAVKAGPIYDLCDWTGSGLTSSDRAVTPVYLGCREGSMTWIYPRGALRLIFRPSLPAGEQDFKICVRVIRRPEPPDLFHTLQVNDTEKPERFPVRLFVEGKHKLVPLYAQDDGNEKELRCFRGRNGHAALYVEAEPEQGTRKRVALFKYEVRPLVRRHYDPATADCRPCSESELELAFCTSELVTRGLIIGSEQRADLDSTQLTLRLTKVIRATPGYDHRDADDLADRDDYFWYDTDNMLEATPHRSHTRRKGRSLHAHIHVSSVCGASSGEGEFLIIARRRLGRYALVCAPRIEDWIELVNKKNADGSAHCTLQH